MSNKWLWVALAALGVLFLYAKFARKTGALPLPGVTPQADGAGLLTAPEPTGGRSGEWIRQMTAQDASDRSGYIEGGKL